MMNTDIDIWTLINIYNLYPDVINFVLSKIKRIEKNKHEFSFSGICDEIYCGDFVSRKPHLPHITGYYKNGEGEYEEAFCLGRSGKLPDGREVIIVIENLESDGCTVPTRASGFYFFRK